MKIAPLRIVLVLACILAVPVAHAESIGFWITQEEIDALPTSGTAWNNLLSGAGNSTNNPDLGNQDDKTDVYTIAKALVYAKTGQASYANEVRDALQALVDDHPISGSSSWDWLGTCRSLGSYAIAADIIDLATFDPSFDNNEFRPWLAAARTAVTEGGRGSVVSSQERRPNNYGAHAGASRIAADLYLQDSDDLARAIQVFRGRLGDRSSYAGFDYGGLGWQADPDNPVGINPAGSTKNGHNIDGVIPDDQRRCSTSFVWPPCKTIYSWEGIQGITVASEMLHRSGYPAFEWENQALLRAVRWLYETTFDDGDNDPATGDDVWQIWIINKRYGTDYPASASAGPGKMVGWTSWSHSGQSASPVPPSINSHPDDLTVQAGDPATFTVIASGTPPLSYQWQRNGSNISGADEASYTLQNAGPGDDGDSFRCVVSNGEGSVTSQSATLTVVSSTPDPPTITSHPQDQTVNAGQSATFSVSATGTAPLSYQWRRNGSNISGATGSSYTLASVSEGDNGASFDCVVSNNQGSATSQSATLTVLSTGGDPPDPPTGLRVE